METYDYVIVGAGSAGCVVAHGLSEDSGTRVLLLEAGPETDRFWVRTPAGMAKLFWDPELNWNFMTEPINALRGREMYWPRGKGLGGSSAINGMIYIRGHRSDFDSWARLGNAGWGYEDVLPYFKAIEHNERGPDAWRAVGGPLWISDPKLKVASSFDFIEAAANTGIPRTDDLNGALHDGVGFMQHTIRNGRRQSAYTAFIAPIRNRPNLAIRSDCLVQRIAIEGRQATGVEVIARGSKQFIAAAREVIVCAGSIGSPQLLMLSGIGPAPELRKHGIEVIQELRGVGANLQDHFYVHTGYRSTPSSSYNRNLRGAWKYLEGARYLATRGGYLSLGASQAAAFVKSGPGVAYADLQISFRPMTFSFHPSKRWEVDAQPGMGVSVCLLRPKSNGAVTLRSANAADPPKLAPNFLQHDDDVSAMVSGLRQIRQIMATAPIASRVTGEFLPGPHVRTDHELVEFMAETGNSAFHQSSTCRMGRDDLAVVDERLCVRDIARLRVVDASVMPHLTSGNTNAPSLMIGAKGADMIRRDARVRRPIAA